MTSILFLGRRDSPILSYLRGTEADVDWTEERLPKEESFYRYDHYVSHSYRHIIASENLTGRFFYNAHISLLPWNRGASPNAFAWYDGTEHGVTVHRIDEGVDTGPIVAQRKIVFGKGETLATSYGRLQAEMYSLFVSEWPAISAGINRERTSSFAGTHHYAAETERIITPLLGELGYDTPVQTLIDAGRRARRE